MIRIRLRRAGKKGHPVYRVVVANQPDRRDGRFIETLGSYDPHQDPPKVTLDADRTREWLGKGAQPSEAAEKILVRAGVLEKKQPIAKVKSAPNARSANAGSASLARAESPEAEPEGAPAPVEANE